MQKQTIDWISWQDFGIYSSSFFPHLSCSSVNKLGDSSGRQWLKLCPAGISLPTRYHSKNSLHSISTPTKRYKKHIYKLKTINHSIPAIKQSFKVWCELPIGDKPSMVNPVVYGPRYGQFGELGARWDNYLGRGHFAQSINPATRTATACQRQCWQEVWQCNKCQPRWCKWGAELTRGYWGGYLGYPWVASQLWNQNKLHWLSRTRISSVLVNYDGEGAIQGVLRRSNIAEFVINFPLQCSCFQNLGHDSAM